MPGHHTEAAFEAAIEAWLTSSGGYATGDREGFILDVLASYTTYKIYLDQHQQG